MSNQNTLNNQPNQSQQPERIIDDMLRVALPKELLNKAGWDARDKISLCYDENQNAIIAKLSKQYVGPKCAFCNSTDQGAAINNKDICPDCMARIVKIKSKVMSDDLKAAACELASILDEIGIEA
jgi:bifunctional DNA-binding transcriptional regulator/antitoxin component of YhaV-PrlF toxin-antitoxin module